MSSMNKRMLWVIPPIIIGLLVMKFMTSHKTAPEQTESRENSYAVRTISVPRIDLVPKAEGYGIVQPAQVWTAVAQVSGRITELNPHLQNGQIIPAGTLLFRIDPVDYELAVAKAIAQLAELEVQRKNAEASLKIEQSNLAIAERELKRLKKLARKGTTSRSSVDDAERSTLNSQALVQNLKNTLALIPTQKRVLEAQLTQAKRDLENTLVKAPFNLRIAGLAIENAQYVSKGQKLFEGDSVDRMEIITQVPISSLRNLFLGKPAAPLPDLGELNSKLREFTGFDAGISLDMGTQTATWKAEFVRFTDTVDIHTRTIGLVVAVDKPMEKIRPGYRPPLYKGMFVKVILKGRVQENRLVIPRSSIRNHHIYLMDSDQRLDIRTITPLFYQDDIAVIDDGLAPGDILVVSDLIPASQGMLLLPRSDDELQQKLLLAGKAP